MYFMDYATLRALDARKFLVELEGDVPAHNSSSAGALELNQPIQQGFHFWSEVLTLAFTTLADDGTDDGVNYLTAQFKDGANQLALSNTFIDLATLAAPGRQRAVGVSGDPSNQLATTGIPFPHLWLATGAVIVDLRNASNTANHFVMTLNGYLIPEAKLAAFDNWARAQMAAPGAMAGY
jgi:hypothetical protein